MGLFAIFSKRATNGAQPTNSPREPKKHAFRGVQVVPHGEGCCEAAKSIADERFLLEDAPLLPLPACDAETCHCTYQRFNDRRTDMRRASDFGFDIASQLGDQTKQISRSPGRRSEDLD